MRPLFQTVTDLHSGAETLCGRAYGVIEAADERLVAVHLRPWPKLISAVEGWWDARSFHVRANGNRCWLYYNQPRSCPNYLAVAYLLSSKDATLATVHSALATLDEIARVKRTDAIVCEASNGRLSDRVLRRYGWETHLEDSGRRHFIKRFYGTYPQPAACLSRPSARHGIDLAAAP
jgi:hypothetical protein